MKKIKTHRTLTARPLHGERTLLSSGMVLEVLEFVEYKPFCYNFRCKDLTGHEYTIRSVSRGMFSVLEGDENISIWDEE